MQVRWTRSPIRRLTVSPFLGPVLAGTPLTVLEVGPFLVIAGAATFATALFAAAWEPRETSSAPCRRMVKESGEKLAAGISVVAIGRSLRLLSPCRQLRRLSLVPESQHLPAAGAAPRVEPRRIFVVQDPSARVTRRAGFTPPQHSALLEHKVAPPADRRVVQHAHLQGNPRS
jgi:hypothetical protein